MRANNIRLSGQRLVVALPRKAACTSLKSALLRATRLEGGRHHYTPHERSLPGWAEIRPEDTPADYELIGVLREPIARIWSGVQQMSGLPTQMSRDDFVRILRQQGTRPDTGRDKHLVTQAAYLRGPDGRMPTSYLYVEHLDEDWAALTARKGWKSVPMPHVHTGRLAFPPAYLDHDTDALMRSGWADDFVLYETARHRREGVLARLQETGT